MFNMSKKLGLFALVCTLAGLAGCGGGKGTDSKKVNLLVCDAPLVVIKGINGASDSCGTPPPPAACPAGQIRPSPDQDCVVSDFVAPTMPATVAADEAVIYINKASADKDFPGYSLYTWQECSATWNSPSNPDVNGADNWTSETINPVSSTPSTADPIYGAYFIVKLRAGGTCGSFIVRTPGRTTQSANLVIQTATTGSPYDRRFFIIENPSTGLVNARTSNVPICINDICEPYQKPALAISDISAHWVTPSTILWNNTVTDVHLYAANDGAKITANLDGTVAGGSLVADLSAGTIDAGDLAKNPQLSAFTPYAIDLDDDTVKSLLKKELVIVGTTSDGSKIGTRIQNYGVLDSLYADAAQSSLGVAYDGDTVTASVWAPTATNVELRLFADTPKIVGDPLPVIATKQMTLDSATGIWSYSGTKAELDRKFYRFRVTGYNALENKVKVLEVADPNAVSLSTNGFHSQFVNLNDSDVKPSGWDDQVVPTVASPEAMSIYEVHVREFSILDASTPVAHRGKYLAFTDSESAPVTHLKELAAAGLTHVHLLPVADGSSTNEDFTQQINLDSMVFQLCVATNNASPICVDSDTNKRPNNLWTLRQVLESYAGNTNKARLLTDSIKDLDGFNWNYDPQFFNAPEGNYATNSNGVTRITEMRAMNLALHNMGLRVVMDVVYPHMVAAGVSSANATFDKVVPGYYFRTNIVTGVPENGTGAGPSTATEHAMMGKFMKDSLVQWADQYKVDGFRFDQSGYLPKSVLVDAYNAVKAVDPTTYFYAEAWVAGGNEDTSAARITELASQKPLAGTGIGTFNDVLRNPLRNFSLVNGGKLDAIRAGLAGNLKNFQLLTKSGTAIKASAVGAYGLDPQESINYADVHDNETLWDWMNKPYVAATTSVPATTTLANRVRIDSLTLSVPLLSQGVPFIQMGSDLLRSKSMTSDSYNSGDWFNRVDFTKQTNNWAVGLPLKSDTADADILTAFANAQTKPAPADIAQASAVFDEFLEISKSPLFSLQTAAEVMDRVGFHDGGTTQVDNVIVMSIDDGAGNVAGTTTARPDLDPAVDAIVVVFNGTNATITRKIATATGFTLHAIQQASVDTTVHSASFADGTGGDAGKGLFTVPAYTTAVFVKAQSGAQGAGLLSTITSGYEPPVPYGDESIYVRGGVFDSGWNATTANEMVYRGNGVYSAALTVPAGTYQFKVASGTSNYQPVNLGTGTATLDTPLILTQNGGNISITFASTGNYRFSLDATDTASPVLTVTNADVFNGTPMYVRGSIFNGWSAAAGNLLAYQGDGVYDVTFSNIAVGDYEFKVANTDYSIERAVDGADQTVTIATPKTFQVGGANAKVSIATAGNYGVKVDAHSATAPVVTVYKDDVYNGSPVYVRGSVFDAGWSAAAGNTLAYAGHGIYSVILNLTQGTAYEFKVADGTYSAVNLGTGTIKLNAPLSLTPNGDNIQLTVPTTGAYTFKLDTTTAAPSITVQAN